MIENFVKGWCASWEAIAGVAGIVGVVLPFFILAGLIVSLVGLICSVFKLISRK